MDLTEDDVLEIMKLFERSKFDFLQLEHGGRKITLSKGGYAPVLGAVSAPAAAHATVAERAPDVSAAASRPAANANPAPTPTSRVVIEEGLTPVPAPMVGKFYAAPAPTAPPFVTVGQRVSPDTTMGLIEVMKVFSSVTAGFAGVVEKILVSNGQSIEAGQPLFLIRQQA